MTLLELNQFAEAQGVDPSKLVLKVWVDYEETLLLQDVSLVQAKVTGDVLEIDLADDVARGTR